jgi:hypothetical protein
MTAINVRNYQMRTPIEAVTKAIPHADAKWLGRRLSRSDTFTPAWMLHFGIALGTHPAHPAHFVGEGRLFFDHIDDVSNNEQFWGGVRVHF